MINRFVLFLTLSSVFKIYSQQAGTITDLRDGKIYKTVVIGHQIWMAENLNVDRFQNGDLIPEAKSNEEWEKAGKEGKPAWCYICNDNLNGFKYGKLYNYYAIIDPRGLAPIGWRISNELDWVSLEITLGFYNSNIKKNKDFFSNSMKAKKGWNFDFEALKNEINLNGIDKFGFSALPSGMREADGFFFDSGGYWWYIKNEKSKSKSYHRGIINCYDNCSYFDNWANPSSGFSVRCLKN
jgi:uncharacterized protein (TIGR02145 family)